MVFCPQGRACEITPNGSLVVTEVFQNVYVCAWAYLFIVAKSFLSVITCSKDVSLLKL